MIASSPRPRAARPGASIRAARSLVLVVVVTTLAACGGATGTSSPSSAPPSPSGGAGTVASPGSKASPWPASAVDAVIALGAADGGLWQAGADIARAADTKDLKAMWGAANGIVKLIDGLMPNVEALEAYPHTQPLGAAYRASFPVLLEGATQLRDSITAGDAKGVVAGSQRLSEGIGLYANVRAMLEGYVNEAVTMKKTYYQ